GVIVLPGSRIGRNVAVGAGSVVTGDLPDHCVAVGSPATVVKQYRPGEGWRSLDQKLAGSSGLTAPKKKNRATSEAAPPTA
ncbi:MAG TPA: hypothetical protein VMF60_04050, partial [Acidimicrobiales bacterium]|nr:hypothetical protein [Acidimicrobiales bacterium]